MLPRVSIGISNGNLGRTSQTTDGVMGLLLQSGSAPSGLAFSTPVAIFSVADAIALGITETYDANVYAHIKQYYNEAGAGAKLWIMLVSNAVSLVSMSDKTQANYAVNLLDAANGEINVLGITRNPATGYAPVLTDQIDKDVLDALPNAQALANEYNNAFKPFRIILEGVGYTGTSATIKDLKSYSYNRVGVFIGAETSGGQQMVGLLLGRLAKIPIQRKVARVKDGALILATAFLGTKKVEEATGDATNLDAKGYITLRTLTRKSGYYFTDDPMAAPNTDDFAILANGRVMDKAVRIAYDTYVNEILDEIAIDTATGRISPAIAKYYETRIETAIDTAMTANAEISGVRAYCDPVQDVLASGKICIDIWITPVAYAREICVRLGFDNPFN